MNIKDRLSYHTWNIGFIEKSAADVVSGADSEFEVHWLQHGYKDRFFADPFILSADDLTVKVLVEDFPYYRKRGMISMLTVDRKTYTLIDRKVILKQPFHMSYPFIQRNPDGSVRWVAPEASASGNLYRYTIDRNSGLLTNQTVLVNEPLLDSTVVSYQGKFWLFCTKRGVDSNSKLYIYYSDNPDGPWIPHKKNPVVDSLSMARPAGNFVQAGEEVYRVIQKCDRHYGEAMNVARLTDLTEDSFGETFVKEIRTKDNLYSWSFHTLNGYGDTCVVDGVRVDFKPLRRVVYEFANLMVKLFKL